MPSPTIRSGHPESVYAVTNPAVMIAAFARTSFRADRNAARVRLPLCDRNCTSMSAHDRLIARAPAPASDRGSGAGGNGTKNFSHAIQSVARPGINRIPARAMPTRARLVTLQPRARAIRKFTEASSKKSMLSAKKRDRADCAGHHELDSKISQVQGSNDNDHSSKIRVHSSAPASLCPLALVGETLEPSDCFFRMNRFRQEVGWNKE